MTIVSCKCPDCGANLENVASNSKVHCEYCGSLIYVSDNNTSYVVHSVNNPEQIGYGFEKGRIKAQREEAEAQRLRALQEEKRQKEKQRNKLIVKILLWVLFLPIMAIVYIIKSPNISREMKFFLVLVIVAITLSYIFG